MRMLLDTNVLCRSIDSKSSEYQQLNLALQQLHAEGAEFCIVPQNLYELWVIITRSISSNGFERSHQEAIELLTDAMSYFTLLEEIPSVRTNWLKLIDQFQVHGKNAHDARLVAAMNAHGVQTLLTLNTKDFARYTMISLMDPLTQTESE
jgi:predicted nucleic acid-binding protein